MPVSSNDLLGKWPRNSSIRRSCKRRLSLEQLEGRSLLATFTAFPGFIPRDRKVECEGDYDSYADTDPDTDSDPDSDAHANSDANINTHANSDANINTHANTHPDINTDTSTRARPRTAELRAARDTNHSDGKAQARDSRPAGHLDRHGRESQPRR
jgi:hypothetical protein